MARVLPALLALLLVMGCGGRETVEPFEGPWRAWLDSPGGELPFGLEIARGEAGLEAVIVNGSERISVPRVEMSEEGLVLGIDHYDSRIVAKVGDRGRRLDGRWEKTAGPEKVSELTFHATAGARPRFTDTASTPGEGESSIDGRWAVRFASSDEPAVGLFATAADGKVEGTFETTTGDYRYLAGSFSDGRLRLSCFDGAHAFLFDAVLQDDETLTGDFWSRDTWHETWVARRNANAELADAFAQTSVIDGIDLARLVYPDLNGVPQSLADPALGGRARLLFVFGSWCPNCSDATDYMVELDRRYRDRGLSIVGLAFELTGDPARDKEQVRLYAAHKDVDYPLLVAGVSDKTQASEAFPLIDRVRAYPTTIFLDAEGAVRAVHSGFSGPATGEAHDELRRNFERLIEQLLDDETTGA
jgi:thiol-disulfide isomerase/thioredoxin